MSQQTLSDQPKFAQGSFSYRDKPLSELISTQKRETLSVGIQKIDEKFNFPTGYYVICANPGAGKGWFSLWLTRQFYQRHGKTSVYFSLEMAEPLVRERALQAWSDLTQAEFNNGRDVSKGASLLQQDIMRIDTFFSDDVSEQTPENFKRKVDFYYWMGYRIFHFDHLHELEGANSNNTNQEVTSGWGRVFQQLCKEYPDIWLFIYAQPNGAAANKTVLRRTDIAGSKAITQKCEFFLSLNRALLEEQNMVTVDQENRTVILWLDKSRVTSVTHIGFKLYFSETGNYMEDTVSFAHRVMEKLT